MKLIIAIVASLIWIIPASAKADTKFPEYRAVVIYTAKKDGPEVREVFGYFDTLETCLTHAQARTNALNTLGKLYGGLAYCQFRYEATAKPKLLR